MDGIVVDEQIEYMIIQRSTVALLALVRVMKRFLHAGKAGQHIMLNSVH